MAYTNLFKKLADAWGAEGDTNTEYGALKAIAENPPFGSTVEVAEILPETVVTSDVIAISSPIIAGKTYTVGWNGTNYTCTAYLHKDEDKLDEGAEAILLGNFAGDTGEPFMLVYGVEDGISFLAITALDDPTSVTLSIIGEKETIKKIEPKYMPEPIVFTLVDEQTATCNKTFEECVEAFKNCHNVILNMGTSYLNIVQVSQGYVDDDLLMNYNTFMGGMSISITYYKDGTITVDMFE